jgi:hypothetical protein
MLFGLMLVATPAVYAADSTGTTLVAANAATVPPACALLTPADLRSVLGGTVGAGDLTTAPKGGETICQWTVVTSANGSGYGAQLDVKTPFSPKDFKQQRQIASGPTKTVKHLGDAAFSERAKIGPQVFDDLWVHKSKLAFRLEVLKDLGSKPLTRLAPIVLTHLATAAGTH